MLAKAHIIHYLPILTTLLSAAFFVVLINRFFFRKRGAHLLWWAAGVLCYGLGTGLEGAITLGGNSVALTKTWFVAGALLGGYPLAQGTVYLLLRRSTANRLTIVTVPLIVVAAICVFLSPVDASQLDAVRPSGSILEWQWIRRVMTPLINSYSVFFLVGGAILSSIRFGQFPGTRHRANGNALIAVGALLPAVGGILTKVFGLVEALYIGEFVGLILIWIGYAFCVRRRSGQLEDSNDLTAVRSGPIPS